MNNRQLATISDDDQLEARASALAPRIKARFPQDCNDMQAREIAYLALQYELDPLMGELIPYQGKPYITIDGRIRIADRHAAYDGYELLWPTGDELKALRPAEHESVWKCVVYRTDRGRPCVAYGRAGGPQDRNPISKNDAVTMAQKRALHRGLRASFPVPIPGLEEKLTPDQLRAIHAYDDDAGVTPEDRRMTLTEVFDVEHSNDLTSAQASAYIDARVVESAPDDEPDAPEALFLEFKKRLSNAHEDRDLTVIAEWATRVGLAGDAEVVGAFKARRRELRTSRQSGALEQPALVN